MCFDVTEWNVFVAAYSEHGMVHEAQSLLERMISAGVRPNEVTLIVLLSCAASHAGLGWECGSCTTSFTFDFLIFSLETSIEPALLMALHVQACSRKL